MEIDNFDKKNLENDLPKSKGLSKFINELKKYIENGDSKKVMNVDNQDKYSNYWKYQNFIEDNVSARAGLSRWGNDITYHDELDKIVDDSLLELSIKEGALYRKQFLWIGSDDGGFYNVDKFDNGEITSIRIPKDIIPSELENKDIIFQYNKNGTIKIRDDLKEKVISLASQTAEKLREKEQKTNIEFKKEGHIYEAFEDDGYIFLNDLTEKRDFSIEDIDFVVDNYQGDGEYQVINGKYEKIE